MTSISIILDYHDQEKTQLFTADITRPNVIW